MSAAQRNGRRLVVTLLGAETRPLRGWQQGAALLDWGFSLPRTASVGRLVTPDDVAAAGPSAPPASSSASRAGTAPSLRAESAHGRSGMLPLGELFEALPVALLVPAK